MSAFLLHSAAAIVAALAAIVVLRSGAQVRRDRVATGIALLVTACWAGSVAALGPMHPVAAMLEVARNIALLIALFRHFANDGRDEALRIVRPLAVTLVAVEGLHLVLIVGKLAGSSDPLETATALRMLVATGALVLVHNLYGGTSDASRRLLAWSSAAFALFWLFELNQSTITALTGTVPAGLAQARPVVMFVMALFLAIGAASGPAGLTFHPSRTVTFSTLSLAMMSGYFLVMLGLASNLGRLGGDLARVTQVGFLLLAATAALAWLPSPRLRDTLRIWALTHLFKHRYDYRAEWLRFSQTIGDRTESDETLHERIIRSLAQIADSGAGALFTPDDEGTLALAAVWRWPTLEMPARAVPTDLVRMIAQDPSILDLDALRARSVPPALSGWLQHERHAWAGVPLVHDARVVGLIVLSRPPAARRLDWEDRDLLRIAGQHVAGVLSEQAGQIALENAARFEDFHRRIAFVMHDIKNLSSQLALLARNAERHADNPAFRDDMLTTLRNSADKLAALVTRLGRYGSTPAAARETFDILALAHRIARRLLLIHPVTVVGEGTCRVVGNEELLEQAILHLVQNAIEASDPGVPVTLAIVSTPLRGEIAVIDAGTGMSAHFVRTGLFRPFVSTKEGGFGIGMCETRDHVRAMGGRLDVQSRPGVGTRATISLPLAEATRLMSRQRYDTAGLHAEEEAA